MLGNPGSNPLELFWDVVDGLDQKLDAKVAIVEAAIKRHNEKLPKASPADDGAEASGVHGGEKPFKIVPETTKEDFLASVANDEEVKVLSKEDLNEIFQTVRITS